MLLFGSPFTIYVKAGTVTDAEKSEITNFTSTVNAGSIFVASITAKD